MAEGKDVKLTKAQRAFLARFVGRGWLHATRDDPDEQAAVNEGLRAGWLRRELGEAHFTPAGRSLLQSGEA
jgi:hypothetical protein